MPDIENVKRGLLLRKELAGPHFLQVVIGGGFVHENGRADPSWECRDCGIEVTLSAHQRMLWRNWVSWRLRADLETLDIVGRKLDCG